MLTPTLRGIALLLAGAASALASTEARADGEPPPSTLLDAGYALKAEHRYDEAERAFERARDAGASRALVDLELGYLAADRGDIDGARRHYADAEHGPDEEVARHARLEREALSPPPTAPTAQTETPSKARSTMALEEAYEAKATGDAVAATAAFRRAQAAGVDPQLVAMELGYLAESSGDPDEAQARFGDAQEGPSPELRDRAGRERALLPGHLHSDLYADAFGWNRVAGVSNGDSIVPTVRVRAFYRPVLSLPVELYLSAQATRDTASRGYVGSALPQVYADDYATFGGGVRARLWNNHIDLFAQVGPALNLLNDGRAPVALDMRAGALAYVETPGCAPAREHGARAGLWPCAEAYGEAVFVSRFNDNLIAFARPRAGVGYLVTGPVAWQMMGEARAGKDLNDDYWNNFADAGFGPRWRLLAPFRLDLMVSADAGRYFGLSGHDPAPARLGYVDGRALATTYVEF